jgi:hypothetical protein
MTDDNLYMKFINHCEEEGVPDNIIDAYTEQVESGYLDNNDLWSLCYHDREYLINNIEYSM